MGSVSERSPRTVWAVRGILLLASVPAWALLTYPGWFAFAVGFIPYFNLEAWLRDPSLLWSPPYGGDPAGGLSLPVPVVEAVAAGITRLGWSPLAALRTVMVLALLGSVWGVFVWQSRRVKPWSALAAALVWLYSPPLLFLAYRLGHVSVLLLGGVVPWLVALLQPAGSSWGRFSRAVGGMGLVLAWAPLAFGGRGLSTWWGVGLVGAFLGTVWVASWVDRWTWGGPLPALAGGAVAAWVVFSLVAPRYVDYKPPAQPVSLFSQAPGEGVDVILLDVRREGPVRAGERFHVVAHWQPLRPVQSQWTVFVQVLDAQNQIWGQQDVPLGADREVSSIGVGEVITGTYSLSVAANAPADVRVIMGVYDRSTMQRFRTLEGSDYVTLP